MSVANNGTAHRLTGTVGVSSNARHHRQHNHLCPVPSVMLPSRTPFSRGMSYRFGPRGWHTLVAVPTALPCRSFTLKMCRARRAIRSREISSCGVGACCRPARRCKATSGSRSTCCALSSGCTPLQIAQRRATAANRAGLSLSASATRPYEAARSCTRSSKRKQASALSNRLRTPGILGGQRRCLQRSRRWCRPRSG